jgi:outer membrane protein assembly factor BamB
MLTPLSRADDWPQWLGPNRDSIWRESGILEKFPPAGPPIRWRAGIGAGYSGPVVANSRVFVTDRRVLSSEAAASYGSLPHTNSVERVLCLNEADGKAMWQYEYECPYTISFAAGPRVAPLVSQGKLYTLGAEGNLFCLDADSGKVLWSHEFKKDFGIKAPRWGFAGHPLLYGNKLICLAGGSGSTAVAFDKDTGKELWRALTAGEPGYSSPVLMEAGGKRQLILWHAEAANSLDPDSGKVFWSVPFKSQMGLSVATPRQSGAQLFFTAFYNGALMLRLDADKPAATVLWRTEKVSERDTTHLNAIIDTPFFENGFIYGVCSYGQLRCLEAETGQRVWETFQATTAGQGVRWANAFIVKNGDRFFLFNELGDLIIARLNPKGYEEVSRAHLLDPTNKDCGRLVVWSHPAFANRCIYARNDKELVCSDLALIR